MQESKTTKEKMIDAICEFIREENCEAVRVPLWGDTFAVVGTKETILKVLELGNED